MDARSETLRDMNICRFCLSQETQLTSIYERQAKENKQSVPLPLQLMACIGIEVFESDGMPKKICATCRAQTQQAYTFKTNCKKADDALKNFLSTGVLTKPWSQDDINEENKRFQATKRTVDKVSPPATSQSSPAKKAKSDVITLNYSNVGPASSDNEKSMDDSSFVQSIQLKDDQDQSANTGDDEDDDEYMEMDSDENILNPTLKVNQVQTDCFPCPDCERSFPLQQLLDLHRANHNRERNYTCSECDKAFFTKYDLSKHQQTHSGFKPFTCVVCSRSFSRESLLHRHEKIHIDVPKYMCTECERTFLTGDDLDAHMAKHKKKRPFVCKICMKSFVFKQGLERHEQTHSNVRPHKCNYCEASFASAIKLTRHVTSHAGLRPYPCKLCGRTFLLSHHLTRHMRSHYATQMNEVIPPVGQHKCDICSMSFRRKDSLINHSAIHSMVNLKCVICNTEFDNVNKVKEHITSHLSDLPFPCEKCDYSFETQEQLEDHELKHAEMEYEEQIEQEVMAEARRAAESGGNEDNDGQSDYSGDDVTEFTITSDLDNPEVVRRSKRNSKIKNYAEFLKDELGSDLEEQEGQSAENTEDEETQGSKEDSSAQEEDSIKPIVRSEGTKVYTRKSMPERVGGNKGPIILNQLPVVPSPSTTQINLLDNLNNDDISKLPDKGIFNMKIGGKTVTVQKRLLTKEQMKAMSKEGKIEIKGNTVLLKKTVSAPSVNLDAIFDEAKGSANKKATITVEEERKSNKKSYDRKTIGSVATTSSAGEEESVDESSQVELNETI